MKFKPGDEVLISTSKETKHRCMHEFNLLTPVVVLGQTVSGKYNVAPLDPADKWAPPTQFVEEDDLMDLEELKNVVIEYKNRGRNTPPPAGP